MPEPDRRELFSIKVKTSGQDSWTVYRTRESWEVLQGQALQNYLSKIGSLSPTPGAPSPGIPDLIGCGGCAGRPHQIDGIDTLRYLNNWLKRLGQNYDEVATKNRKGRFVTRFTLELAGFLGIVLAGLPGWLTDAPEESASDLHTSNGQRLYNQCWGPSGLEQGWCIVLILADYGDHSCSVAVLHAAEAATHAGAMVSVLDTRGTGRSQGHRTAPTPPQMLQDQLLLANEVRSHAEGRPVFALGIGIGACVAIKLAGDNPGLLDGLILVSPSLKLLGGDRPVDQVGQQTMGVIHWWAKGLSDLFIAHDHGAALPTERLHDRDVCWSADGQADSIARYDAYTTRSDHPVKDEGIRKLCSSACKLVLTFTIPICVMHGTRDTVACFATVQKLHMAYKGARSLHVFDDAQHGIFENRDTRSEATQHVKKWLKQRR